MRPGKVVYLILGVFVLFLSTLNLLADVIVYDEKSIQDSLSKDQDKKESSVSTSGTEGEGVKTSEVGKEAKVAPIPVAQKPELGPGGMSITLEGMRMGDTVTSSAVILSQTGVILEAKTEPIGLVFSIMRVDKNGETPILGVTSSDSVTHKKLPAGTYKVYPVGNLPGGAASTEKTKVSISIGPE